MAYFVLLNLTLIVLCSHDSHSKPVEKLIMLSELSKSWHSLLFLGSDGVLLDMHVQLIISLTS